jgi:hypothetical protein
MSLKAFHITFIIVSTLMAFGFALWAFLEAQSTGSASATAAGAGGVLAGIGLILYGIRFLRKLKHVSFI